MELEIWTRDYRCVKFRFGTDKISMNYLSPERVQQMLRMLAFPSRIQDLFAFEYFKNHSMAKLIIDKKKMIKQQSNLNDNNNNNHKNNKEKNDYISMITPVL